MIGYNRDHVMVQFDKLLSLGLAERRDVLEKSGLCMFCLRHSAEFECYGRGGLSKPRCTHSGCDGEHTPNLHRLMGEDNAKVSLVAGSEAEEGFEAKNEYEARCEYEHELEWEYEDGGLWVGTVGAVEMEWGKETPAIADALGLPCSENPPRERGTGEQIEERSDFQGEEDRAEEAAEDGWWDLRAESPGPEDVEVNAVQVEPPHRFPREAPRPSSPTAVGEQWTKRKQESSADQQWEEARQHARQRQLLGSGLGSEDEDEDEEQQGEWRLERYEPP